VEKNDGGKTQYDDEWMMLRRRRTIYLIVIVEGIFYF
jgi:hypothetical protein